MSVPGGSYNRTYTNEGDGGASEADPATVSAFRLDKYLVTVGRLRQYVNYLGSDSGAPPAEGSGKHVHLNNGQGLANVGGGAAFEQGWDSANWNANIATGSTAPGVWTGNLTTSNAYDSPAFATWTDSAGSNENLPANVVTWYEAYAFCIWDGGFLPSEAEWEYVAAGGNQQREYPWGSVPPGTANQYAIYGGSGDCYYPTGTAASCTGVANIAPVGTASSGAGLWGQLDLAGNVYEWILDWLAPYVDPCTDCANVTTATDQVLHGGYWGSPPTDLLPPARNIYSTPVTRDTAVGFRCARAP